MLSLEVVREIERLLDEGRLSQRQIASRLGVSRGSVGAIANGYRGIWGKQSDPDDDDRPMLPPRRCPQCGMLVYMPCMICRVRAYRQRVGPLGEAANGNEVSRLASSGWGKWESATSPVRHVPHARVA